MAHAQALTDLFIIGHNKELSVKDDYSIKLLCLLGRSLTEAVSKAGISI